VPEVEVRQRFNGESLVLRVHRLDPPFGLLSPEILSGEYSIHGSVMIEKKIPGPIGNC